MDLKQFKIMKGVRVTYRPIKISPKLGGIQIVKLEPIPVFPTV